MNPPYPATSNLDVETTFLTLAKTVEPLNGGIAGHCARIAWISVAVGAAMELASEDLLSLYCGAYLHDIGSVGISRSILLKPGELSTDEWSSVRCHPALGEEICKPLRACQPFLPLIRSHHERWDGSGYPDGLKGGQIPLLVRILQIADVYYSLVSPRPYREPHSRDRALTTIQDEAARGWRDPTVVTLFLETLAGPTQPPTLEDSSEMGDDLKRILSECRGG